MSRSVRNRAVTGLAVALCAGLVSASVMGTTAGATPLAKKKAIPLTAVLKRPAGHPVAGQKVLFTLRGTRAASTGGTITSYLLDFGDRSKKASGKKVPPTIAHTYAKAGKYTLTFTVVDSKKHKATVRTGMQIMTGALAGGGASTGTTSTVSAPLPGAVGTACLNVTHPAAGPTAGTGQLTGHVTDGSGNPLPGVPVTLFVAGGIDVPYSVLFAGITIPLLNVPLSSLLNLPGNLVIPNITNTVTTDANGNYGLDALPVGWVPPIDLGPLAGLGAPIIGTIQGDLRTEILDALVNPQVQVNVGPGADLHYSQASPARGGKDATGQSLAGGIKLPTTRTFKLVPAGNVTGTVVGSGGPVAGEGVEALLPTGYITSDPSAADGSFTLPQLPLTPNPSNPYQIVGQQGAGHSAVKVVLTACQPDVNVGNVPG